LGEHFAELGVVFVFIDMVYADMPLKIVWPRVFMFPVRTKWAYIARRLVDEPMSNHLILAFEAFTSLSSRTALDWAIMWSIL